MFRRESAIWRIRWHVVRRRGSTGVERDLVEGVAYNLAGVEASRVGPLLSRVDDDETPIGVTSTNGNLGPIECGYRRVAVLNKLLVL